MTLAELNAAWQRMRTAVIGRGGFEENVSPALASRFVQTLAGWDIWYANAGPMSDVLGSVDPEVMSWLKRYRDLELDVRREGLQLPVLTETPGEMLPDVRELGIAAAVVAALVGGVWFLKRKRSR